MTSMVKLFWAARNEGRFKNLSHRAYAEGDELRVVNEVVSQITTYRNAKWDDLYIFKQIVEEANCASNAQKEQRAEEWTAVFEAALAYARVTEMERNQAKAWLRGI